MFIYASMSLVSAWQVDLGLEKTIYYPRTYPGLPGRWPGLKYCIQLGGIIGSNRKNSMSLLRKSEDLTATLNGYKIH
ncbi:MAG: hypothetical protein COA36_11335 [Desulfotalea sp.]|nr:MAG: hypothetical protein COA36_11335 [Desulfotalea sp.]